MRKMAFWSRLIGFTIPSPSRQSLFYPEYHFALRASRSHPRLIVNANHRVLSGENQKPLQTSSLYLGMSARLDCTYKARLQLRRQVNRRHHAARAPAAKLDRRELNRHEPRVAAQSFVLFVSQSSIRAAGKHKHFCSILIV